MRCARLTINSALLQRPSHGAREVALISHVWILHEYVQDLEVDGAVIQDQLVGHGAEFAGEDEEYEGWLHQVRSEESVQEIEMRVGDDDGSGYLGGVSSGGLLIRYLMGKMV
jgi:hypothetical protein